MTNKVIWSEGMFLRPHHFQQHERYITQEIDNRCRPLMPYGWGFSRLKINQANLEIGQFSLDDCAGCFSDGSSFDGLQRDGLPLSIKVPAAVSDVVIYLAIPLRQAGVPEVGDHDQANSLVRYRPRGVELMDSTSREGTPTQVQVGDLHLRLYIHDPKAEADGLRVPDGYTSLAVAHINAAQGGKLKLRQLFIPSVQHYAVSAVLRDFLTELLGMLAARATGLAGRVSNSGGKGGVAEVTDFMLLQLLNRSEPVFAHCQQLQDLHPAYLYERLLALAGELATFMNQDKRPLQFPAYDHENLMATFAPLFSELRAAFSAVLEQIAQALPLSPAQYGIRAARLEDRELLKSADFVLAVSAEVSGEKLRTLLPAQIKIGPVEKIRELITSALPGIDISPLPVAPREIPYHAGFTYFELNVQNPLWKEFEQSGGIAFHVGGEFPGMECQFWAIKRR
ncbi:MAG: type VI secretion system protein ImpJ [Motiliproteus sp.]|jgi:type VI secretion system protein ImpJ